MRGSRKFSRGGGGGGGGTAVQIPRRGLTDMANINNLAIQGGREGGGGSGPPVQIWCDSMVRASWSCLANHWNICN